MSISYDFTGKTAVVTGAAMGIGAAAARRFAEAGAYVVLADVQEEGGRQLADELTDRGYRACFIQADVGDDASVSALMNATYEIGGRLDCLYNNAGVAIGGEVTEMSEDSWQKLLNINLGGVFRGCKYAIPHMLRQGGGAIVNCSSTQALRGFMGWAGYAATKGGILSLTRQAAMAYARQGVRINAVAPGTIMTPMNEGILAASENPQAMLRQWGDIHPVGRCGRPEEVADLVLYLSSDAAAFITGQTFVIDGGQSVRAE